MKACRGVLVLMLVVFAAVDGAAQNITGIPNIINFSKKLYNAGIQNWDIIQDKNGYIYSANNEGLLSFDGTVWKLYPFPNKLIVRSIAVGEDNRIYAGGQNEFGYFAPDQSGVLHFTSLKSLLTREDQAFEYILDVVVFGNEVFFRERDKMFLYNQKSLKIFKASISWRFLALDHDRVVAQDGQNLLQFRGSEWVPVTNEPIFQENSAITALIPFGQDSSLIITRKGTAYILSKGKVFNYRPWKNKLSRNLVLCATPISDDVVAIGTDLGGCYFLNKRGEVVQNISKKDGLQNNTIVSLFRDNRQNLWLGLDNGIDFIATNNAIKQVYPEKFEEAIGYSSIIYHDELYIGTSKGLFKAPLLKDPKEKNTNSLFTFVPNSTGSVWSLCEVDGNLLMANHVGAFVIKKEGAEPINTTIGYWGFLPLRSDGSSNVVIAGTYKGIELFAYTRNTFRRLSVLDGLNTAPRSMVIDDAQSVWVGTSFNGVMKIDFDHNLQPIYKAYTATNGLPSLLRNRICKVKNQILSATENGIYQYNRQKDLFEESKYYNQFFKGKDVRLLKEDQQGNVWFIEGRSIGFVDAGNKKNLLYFPELDGKIVSGNSLEFIYPYDANNILVAAEKGFYQINHKDYKKNVGLAQVKIISVQASGRKDTLLFGGYQVDTGTNAITAKKIPNLNSSFNSFHFEYSSPSYSHQLSIQYSVILEGVEKQWSNWTRNTQKDYTNLPAGTFTFKVKAKTSLGDQPTTDAFTFTIMQPWSKSWWAYLLYASAFVLLIYLLHKEQRRLLLKQQKKYEEEQEKLHYLHRLEIENSEKEIIALRNEKLKAEIESKNSELASVAMQMVHKGEILSKVKDELERLKKISEGSENFDNVKKLIKSLKEEDKMDDEWKQFSVHFDHIHSNFTKVLKNTYPVISQSELKLAVYLHMNLSSKEIAQLLNISVRGVEISRYRLRKKLQIPTETNLNDFFQNFLKPREKPS